MGTLAEALRQLDNRLPEPPAQVESAPEIKPVEPLAMDYADAPDPLAAPSTEGDVVEPATEQESPAAVFTDLSFNRALHFADSVIQAADAVDEADVWRTVELPMLEPEIAEFRLDPCGESANNTSTSSDLLATVSVDRSYGRLWDSLSAALVDSPPWAIVVAASGSGDDVSWLMPTAIAFAQRHPGEILLVDASAKRRGLSPSGANPSYTDGGGLSGLLGLTCRRGLADVLQGAAKWRDAVEPTAVARIGLLGRGQFVSIADSALKASAAKLIAELKSNYQLILIQASDACDPLVAPLVAASDGTLLMLELGRTARAAAEKASSSLYLAGARLLGCVVRG